MSKTEENLKEAFAGECQASIRYVAFAEKADAEGYPGAARLFRAAARAEIVHALSHLRVLGEVKATQDNVETAIQGESFEFKEMYPAMVKDAVEDNNIEARHSLEYAMSIEMVHAKLFKKAVEEESTNASSHFYVCPVCGHTVRGKAPKKCPYCGVDEKRFMEIQ
ncbi:MAG: rubrerythrin family protein [Desulfomonile tiedjei]|uniref:Rubrerythrin family protein n=1 Tax=Desulfomonile tiedjei TaxID=2358 RepID=A0A9D6V2I8_9BACT|nr:rubrerythrin family protein [Desulfomonile tiedjei]